MIGLHNISAYVDHHAAARPGQRAVVFPEGRDRRRRYTYSQLTFAQLKELSDAYAGGMRRLGIGRGDRVSVFLKPSLDLPAVTFALFKIGAVPVFIDPGMGRAQALQCVKKMAPKALISIPLLQALRPLFADAFQSVEIKITAGSSTGYWGGHTLDELLRDSEPVPTERMDPDEEAAILFTSGSTGPAKGVVYSHRIYDAQTRYIQQLYGIEPGEVDLAAFPLFALFSIAMGMTAVFADVNPMRVADADPAGVVQMLEEQGATNAFGSPALWKPVARYCQRSQARLPLLKRILSAGAPIPVWMHEAFQQILDGGQIHTPYGATESLPVATIGSWEILSETAALTRQGRGTCVGRLAPGLQLQILPIRDEAIDSMTPDLPLPLGEIGEICVTGEQVTRAYAGEPEANRLSKIRDGERIWHRIGDVGYLDERGRLWFCGRKSHRVESRERRLFSDPVEGILNETPGVARTALVGVGAQGAQEPVIVIEPEPGADGAALKAEVLRRAAANPVTAPITRALTHPSFPVDVRHNAKIKRELLATWAEKEL